MSAVGQKPPIATEPGDFRFTSESRLPVVMQTVSYVPRAEVIVSDRVAPFQGAPHEEGRDKHNGPRDEIRDESPTMVRQICWTEHEDEDCHENYNPRMGQRRAVYPRWLKF